MDVPHLLVIVTLYEWLTRHQLELCCSVGEFARALGKMAPYCPSSPLFLIKPCRPFCAAVQHHSCGDLPGAPGAGLRLPPKLASLRRASLCQAQRVRDWPFCWTCTKNFSIPLCQNACFQLHEASGKVNFLLNWLNKNVVFFRNAPPSFREQVPVD